MMDPMQAPILVIRNLEKFLDVRTKRLCRLVSPRWKEMIEDEGELRIVVSPSDEGNWEFIKSIRKPSSICFKEKHDKDEDPSLLRWALPLRIHIMCQSDFSFLKRQLSPPSRAILVELVFSDNFLWRSVLMCSTQDLTSYDGERCYLPSLKTLRFSADARAEKVYSQWNVDYNSWASTFRRRAQRNIQFILNLLVVPSLTTYIAESVCCSQDNDTKNIKDLVSFIHGCAHSLKIIKMNNQRSDVLRNYREDAAIPKLDDISICLFDVEPGLDTKVFNTESYWGRLLKTQSTLRKIRWEYLDFVPQDFVYSVILANQDTLEEFVFSCTEHNTRMVIIEPVIKIFKCNIFSGCKRLRKLSLSVDWEIINIQALPKNIENLIFHGCLIANENLFRMDLPRLKSVEMSRNIFSTGQDNVYYEINIDTFNFLASIRSLDSIFIEKLKDDVNGPDCVEEYFKHFQAVSLPIPDDKFFPDHFVSIKL